MCITLDGFTRWYYKSYSINGFVGKTVLWVVELSDGGQIYGRWFLKYPLEDLCK